MLLTLSWLLAAAPAPAPVPGPGGTPSRADALVKSLTPGAQPESGKPVPLRWDVPGLIAWVDTDGPLVANGMPVLIQLARSSRSVDDLAAHFVRFFEKADLYIAPLEQQAPITREPQLTALDPRQMLSYTVILQANPDKTTSVILGTANVGAWKPNAQSQLLGWAPLMPGASNVLRTDAEGQWSAAFDVESTPDKVQAFYREALGKAGYKATGQAGEYQRETEWIRVRARADEKGRLMVWLVRQVGGVDPAAPAP